MSNFRTQYLKGAIKIDDVDKFVDQWHSSPNIKVTLQEFLGLTDEEHEAFLHELSDLKKILDSQKYKAVANYGKTIDKHYKDAK